MLVAQVRDRSVELVPVEAHEVHASALRNEEPRGCESDAALPPVMSATLSDKTSHTTLLQIETSITHVRAADAPLNLSRAPESQSTRVDATHTGNTSLQTKEKPDRTSPTGNRRSASGQVALIPGAWLTAEVGRVGRADRDEPGFGQHLLGRGILAGGGRPEGAQPVVGRRQPAQLPDGRGRHATTGDMLRDPVAELPQCGP